jgi:hypothetical protein
MNTAKPYYYSYGNQMRPALVALGLLVPSPLLNAE